MELTVTKQDLSKALSATQSVVEKKTTMPILSNVLISATDKQLRIASTDYEITMLLRVKANVHSTGSTTVNARVFTDIVRELPDGEVKLKLTEGERLEISAKNSKFKMVGVSAEEYPSLPGIAAEVTGRVEAKQLHEMINKTLYAVSQDETRFNLNGVCFELAQDGAAKKKGSNLRMVATDGHRLAMITRPVENLSFAERIIVPKKGLAEIRKVIDTATDRPVGMDVKDGFLLIETEDAKISMRLIDGEFPDYNQVLPAKAGTLAVTQSSELAQALRRVALMVTDKAKGVRLDFSKSGLKISSSSPELGEARESLDVKYDGPDLSVGFNARYLLEMAQSLDESQTLVMALTGELGAAKFYAEGDESYIGVVMPMRLT
ncbi:MAG: DNA polymerase III subunit beta [Oligoflexia bacterium]|nr:DNA polymerase III subunit beta [Oligoflexia bacterium]